MLTRTLSHRGGGVSNQQDSNLYFHGPKPGALPLGHGYVGNEALALKEGERGEKQSYGSYYNQCFTYSEQY